MNKLLTYNSGFADQYDISINSDFSGMIQYFARDSFIKHAKICVATDLTVADLYIDEVLAIFVGLGYKVYSYEFVAGEASKNHETLNKLYEYLIANRFDRHDMLVALGGGVVGDLCGYCAATYLRGIDYVQIPTTLLSQVDSSIGGKTAIDFMQYKNMVGAFYMPKLVYINVSTLKSLPKEQFSCGMGEVIKHGLIQDKAYYDYIIDNRDDIISGRAESLIELVYGSVAIKSKVVETDPTEKGIRAYLNFGHTIGHAIEKLSDYKLFHGQCVAIGMMSALFISRKMGYIKDDDINKARKTLELYGLPTRIEDDSISAEDILYATKSDKKMDNGRIKFVVLEEIGKATTSMGVDDELLSEAIEYIR